MKKYIAIDGPAGAGKSTVARKLAQKLGYLYLDTGALYRAVTLYALQHGIDLGDLSQIRDMLSRITISLETNQGLQVFLNGEEVTKTIRSPQVDRSVSKVAEIKMVRDFLRETQRKIALSRPSVVEGRDIGTVILPEADLKIFLTANPETRAHRRWLELREKGDCVDYKSVLKNILERDTIDSSRAHAPLRKANDAIVIDTSFLTIEEVINKIYALAING